MLAPDIYSGMGVAAVMAQMVHAGQIGGAVVVVMLILALVLSLMTSMAGSSRTLYQASLDGWLPQYLAKVNTHGAPTNAMLTNLVFNLVLLLLSDSVFIIGAANIGYLIFNFLNLNAGWIHRLRQAASGAAVARADLDTRRRRGALVREPRLHGLRRRRLRFRHARDRAGVRGADRARVHLSPLRPGQGLVSAGDGPGFGERRAASAS